MFAERTSADVGETVLVSRNVPIGGEKAVPAILKAKDDAKEIQIENEVHPYTCGITLSCARFCCIGTASVHIDLLLVMCMFECTTYVVVCLNLAMIAACTG